jgi:hypothetical protein
MAKIIKNACFAVEPNGLAPQGFSGYLDGRLPTDDELPALSGTARRPGDYVVVSYDDRLDFDELFDEVTPGLFSLSAASAQVVVKRVFSVPS